MRTSRLFLGIEPVATIDLQYVGGSYGALGRHSCRKRRFQGIPTVIRRLRYLVTMALMAVGLMPVGGGSEEGTAPDGNQPPTPYAFPANKEGHGSGLSNSRGEPR